jgi:hypothetical protein
MSADCPLEKWFRDAKIFQLFEGTAEIQRQVIARMQVAEYRRRLAEGLEVAAAAMDAAAASGNGAAAPGGAAGASADERAPASA